MKHLAVHLTLLAITALFIGLLYMGTRGYE